MIDREIALQKYKEHKNSTYYRNDKDGNRILMKLSFEEWLDIWEKSGKWDLRGRGKGKYCMSRKNDIGHYEIGNVEIKLFTSNSSEGVRRVFTEEENKKKARPGELNGMFGKKHSDEAKQKIKEKNRLQDRSWMIGRKHSEETKQKQSLAAKNRIKQLCPYCNKEFSPINFVRWHGNNCKLFSLVDVE